MHDQAPSDEQLVGQTISGDREAFGRLYDRYAPLVRAMIWTTSGDRSSLGDLSQETFLRAYRNLAHLSDRAKFGSWVAGIARQVSRERNRTLKRDRHNLVSNLKIELSEDTAAQVDAADRWSAIEIALGKLKERERLAIHLFYLDGESADAAAKALGMSRSGMYALLERAIARLAKLLRPLETESEKTQ